MESCERDSNGLYATVRWTVAAPGAHTGRFLCFSPSAETLTNLSHSAKNKKDTSLCLFCFSMESCERDSNGLYATVRWTVAAPGAHTGRFLCFSPSAETLTILSHSAKRMGARCNFCNAPRFLCVVFLIIKWCSALTFLPVPNVTSRTPGRGRSRTGRGCSRRRD